MNIVPRSDLGLLAILVAIDDSGSISLAADKLNVSQPTVSHALKRLRDLTEDELFRREGGRLKRTAHAMNLLPKARKMVAEGSRLLAPSTFDPATSNIQIRIAATHYAAHSCLKSALRELQYAMPNAQFLISWVENSSIQEMIDKKIDFIFSGEILHRAIGVDLTAHQIFDENYIGVMCRKHPLASKIATSNLSIDEWLAYPHIKFSSPGTRASLIEKKLNVAGKERITFFTSPSHSLNLFMLCESQSFYALPSRFSDHIEDEILARFEIPIGIKSYPFYLIYPKKGQQSAELEFVRDVIVKVFESQ